MITKQMDVTNVLSIDPFKNGAKQVQRLRTKDAEAAVGHTRKLERTSDNLCATSDA